jgi:hypothetical protein
LFDHCSIADLGQAAASGSKALLQLMVQHWLHVALCPQFNACRSNFEMTCKNGPNA